MARDKGRSKSEMAPPDEEEPNEGVGGLMAKINSNAGDRTSDPVMGQMEDDSSDASAQVELFGSKMEPPPPPAYVPPANERWGKLMSRMNNPLDVLHQEGAIRLSPRGIVRVDGNKLDTLPMGATFVPDRR